MNALIRADAIHKGYGSAEKRQTVLRDVSLEIPSGQYVAVVGPSGSGKSTLLFVLSGTDEVDAGSRASA